MLVRRVLHETLYSLCLPYYKSPVALLHGLPFLWSQLPYSFRQPHSVHSPPGLAHPAHITSSQSPPSLSPSITPSAFHCLLRHEAAEHTIKYNKSTINTKTKNESMLK